MKYENPEIEFIRLAMQQEVITASWDEEGDGLIDDGLNGEGNSSGIGGVLP